MRPFQLSTFDVQLRRYFYSGWAFLIPYLFVYLIYAWQKWPANPRENQSMSGFDQASIDSQWSIIPSLLYVYWGLHAFHLVLAAIAFRSWWRGTSHIPSITKAIAGITSSPTATRYLSLRAFLPWVLLALLFWIPGIYLEWPSDPWEHLRRINEWHAHGAVLDHSVWRKSSYFLPYSLTEHLTGPAQLRWLNIYYTAVCLLLCWQYYRLARSVSLGERSSFVFVLVQALFIGNNIFSFYRYYGLSSSIFAQIAAVALTRVALETVRTSDTRRSYGEFQTPLGIPILQSAGAGFALLSLIAFSHLQGLAIASVGILAVAVWRLIEWRRKMVFWLIGAAVSLSFCIVLWFPRHPALDEIYLPQVWLSGWYGFAIFDPTSIAFGRTYQILGAVGLLNSALGLRLLARNHVLGWLTLMPITVLALPCFALPIAHILATYSSSPANIVTFHRLLLGIPVGLVLVAEGTNCIRWLGGLKARYPQSAAIGSHALLLGACGLLVTLSPGSSCYNRLFHAIFHPPADLMFEQSREHAQVLLNASDVKASNYSLVVAGLAYKVSNTQPRKPDRGMELVAYSLTTFLPLIDAAEFVQNRPPGILIPPSAMSLYTPSSTCALLSNHWLPQKAAYEQMGEREFEKTITGLGFVKASEDSLTYYFYGF